MRVLALDTTSREGSVALVVDDRVVEERRGDPSRTHAERLPREVVAVAEAHGLALPAIDVFAVATGPGSFTGLRVGIATMQGLAFVAGRPLVGVSALDALAHLGSLEAEAGSCIAAWIDARRGEVFSALYRVAAATPFHPGRLEPLEPPSVGDPAETLRRWKAELDGRSVMVTGDGAAAHAQVVRTGLGAGVRLLDPPPLAAAIGRIAGVRAVQGETGDPAAIRPLYVRRPDAELDREKRRVGH